LSEYQVSFLFRLFPDLVSAQPCLHVNVEIIVGADCQRIIRTEKARLVHSNALKL